MIGYSLGNFSGINMPNTAVVNSAIYSIEIRAKDLSKKFNISVGEVYNRFDFDPLDFCKSTIGKSCDYIEKSKDVVLDIFGNENALITKSVTQKNIGGLLPIAAGLTAAALILSGGTYSTDNLDNQDGGNTNSILEKVNYEDPFIKEAFAEKMTWEDLQLKYLELANKAEKLTPEEHLQWKYLELAEKNRNVTEDKYITSEIQDAKVDHLQKYLKMYGIVKDVKDEDIDKKGKVLIDDILKKSGENPWTVFPHGTVESKVVGSGNGNTIVYLTLSQADSNGKLIVYNSADFVKDSNNKGSMAHLMNTQIGDKVEVKCSYQRDIGEVSNICKIAEYGNDYKDGSFNNISLEKRMSGD